MRNDLPNDHGLSTQVLNSLVFHEYGRPSLTEIQYQALAAGIVRDKSLLVVSPTSTGKTHIAIWAVANALQAKRNAVYLVTHKALAKQKFRDLQDLLGESFLGGNKSTIAVATGDYVENGEGETPADPLHTPLLIATYEKYLGMLSSAGVPGDMGSTCIVCDELQLIGDATRGQHVEILLALLKNAGWHQFVGLSAVLDTKDASELANWLQITLVSNSIREKHLKYECRTRHGVLSISTDKVESLLEDKSVLSAKDLEPLEIVKKLLKETPPPTPIIVFCVRRKQDTYDLAEAFVREVLPKGSVRQLSFDFDGLPETTANAFLANIVGHRVAVHSADLTDDERQIIESHLLQKKLDVVFATTTLAAGVNFPLGAAVFASWHRWEDARRTHVPIDSAEFHNMAGRVGRMGFGHQHGRIIFCADDDLRREAAMRLLRLSSMPRLVARINPKRFDQLAMQLVASGLCHSRSDIWNLVSSTFSALREQDTNTTSFGKWSGQLTAAVDWLVSNSLLLETTSGRLVASAVGRAIAFSGLLPRTGVALLAYSKAKATMLASLLPTHEHEGDIPRLAFLLFATSYSSPEFRPQDGSQPTRFLPWPLGNVTLINGDHYSADLVEPVWRADVLPINAAAISWDWINGSSLRDLELQAPPLSAGMLREMFVNLAWVMQGWASIVEAAADPRLVPVSSVADKVDLPAMRKLPRFTRRLARRVSEGLPDELLWYVELNTMDSKFKVGRHEVLSLRDADMATPESASQGAKSASDIRAKVFEKAKPSPNAKGNWLRDTVRSWKVQQRKRTAERHLKRARRCSGLEIVELYYGARGSEFEKAFEKALTFVKIKWTRLDDRTKTGAPDYLLEIKESPPLIVELKSKEGEKLVDFNGASEVLSASEIHGHGKAFCVTLCHPGVDPSVPQVIIDCGRLSVVESGDLGEAFLRLCEGSLSQAQFWLWLATPGQALASDLPFREFR